MKDLLLTDGTVGRFNGDCSAGDIVTVELHDENGMPIEVTGTIEEILTDDE